MTVLTIRRKAAGYVVWIGGRSVVGLMTRITIGWRVFKTGGMTGHTLILNRQMGAGQRKQCAAVVKHGRCPIRTGRVAIRAGR